MKTHAIQIKYSEKQDMYAYNSKTNMLDVISKDCSKNSLQMQPGMVYFYTDGIHVLTKLIMHSFALVIYCKTDKSLFDFKHSSLSPNITY